MATVPPLIPGTFGSAFGSALGGSLGGSLIPTSTTTNQNTTGSQKKILTKEAQDKLIYDVLSSDQGLAALASGENASGGFGSSTKGLMAQDLTAKIIGELANITAETITSQDTTSTSKKKVGTVICTELVRLGLMDRDLYDAGATHFRRLPLATVLGYQAWAVPVASFIRRHPRIAPIFLPVANARYRYLVHGTFSIIGWASVRIAEPICWMIGQFFSARTPLVEIPEGK